MTIEQSIGVTIRQARRSRGWSVEELAKRTGINAKTLYQAEAYGANFWPTIRDCAQALRMTPAGMLSIAEIIAAEHKRHVSAVSSAISSVELAA